MSFLSIEQKHLTYRERINLGAYYTPPEYVAIVWNFIKPYIGKESVVLDTACGYGNFFTYPINCIKKAGDIDEIACNITKQNFHDIEVYNINALCHVSRSNYTCLLYTSDAADE